MISVSQFTISSHRSYVVCFGIFNDNQSKRMGSRRTSNTRKMGDQSEIRLMMVRWLIVRQIIMIIRWWWLIISYHHLIGYEDDINHLNCGCYLVYCSHDISQKKNQPCHRSVKLLIINWSHLPSHLPSHLIIIDLISSIYHLTISSHHLPSTTIW